MRMLLLLLPLTQLGCPPSGGCAFNESSEVTASAAATCVTVAATTGQHDPTDPSYPANAGCTIPMLYGVNECAEPLRFSSPELVVAPGERFEIEVLEAPVAAGGRDLYAMPATVGGVAVVFTFSTNRL